jgi:hypothetical protein
MGGGDPDSGSADKRGKVDATEGLLTPGQVADLKSIGRALDEAQKEIRSNKVDPELLKQLGMNMQGFQGFVETYVDKFGKVKPMLERTDRPNQTLTGAFVAPGSRDPQAGKGLDNQFKTVQGGEKLQADGTRKLFETPASKVEPAFRKGVDSYFRAVSEAGVTPTSGPAK